MSCASAILHFSGSTTVMLLLQYAITTIHLKVHYNMFLVETLSWLFMLQFCAEIETSQVMTFEIFLRVNIWSCLCWVGIPVFGGCWPLCVLDKWYCSRVLGKECFCGSVGDTKYGLEGTTKSVCCWICNKGYSSMGIESKIDF